MKPLKTDRPVWLDGIPAFVKTKGGYAVVHTVGHSRKARFAWGAFYAIMEKDGRFKSSEGVP